MTLSKLAALANVSVSVVSKAFSGRADVSDSMREHVFAVAKENGCFEQFYHARYDKPVIAVIIPEVISQYYTRYMHLLQNAIEKNGYTMLLSISNFDRHLAEELTRYYTQHHRTDGLIMFGSERGFPQNSKTVGIQITEKEPQNVGASVSHVLDGALEQALRYLQAKGHTKIAYVGEAFTEGKKSLLQKKMQERKLTALQHNEDSDSDTEMGENESQGKCSFSSF